MLPYDEECHRRIARHRQMRAKKGFETLEVPYALQQLELTEPMQSGCALLECMSNLVANELFCPQGSGEPRPRKPSFAVLSAWCPAARRWSS